MTQTLSYSRLRESAELFKLVAHPARLVILKRLEAGVLCVSEMGELLGAAQPYVSQHLAVLRRSGIIDCHAEGKQRCYFIKDPRALDILSVLNAKPRKKLAPAPCLPSGRSAAKGKNNGSQKKKRRTS